MSSINGTKGLLITRIGVYLEEVDGISIKMFWTPLLRFILCYFAEIGDLSETLGISSSLSPIITVKIPYIERQQLTRSKLIE